MLNPPIIPKRKLLLFIHFFNSDPRHYQLCFHTIFLSTGIIFLGFSLSIAQIFITLFTCLLTQYFAIRITGIPLSTLKSALITFYSLCLMFRSDHPGIIFLASFLSIASKFIFRVKGKHIFNPANFGICAVILLSGHGWISPGQWGNKGLCWFLIGILGLIVTNKAKRFDTAAAFLLAFGGLMAFRILIYQQWPLDFFMHQFTNGNLLLFTFFMITDPVSTPSNKTARIIWAASIGALAFYLQAYQWITGSPIWALFIISAITPFIDYFFKGERFYWTNANIYPKIQITHK